MHDDQTCDDDDDDEDDDDGDGDGDDADLEAGDHRLAALEAEALGRVELDREHRLELLGEREPLEQLVLLLLGHRRRHDLDALAQPEE
jgi:hypothetical protein